MGSNRDWRMCKGVYIRKGPKGPTDYLSPKEMQKILNRKSADESEWLNTTLTDIKNDDRRDKSNERKCYCSNKVVCPDHKE